MKIDGIKGDATDEAHKDEIELTSMSFGLGRGISGSVGQTKNREASHPSFSEISITKALDQSTPNLFTEACVGQTKKVEIFLVKTSEGASKNFMEYTLTNVLFSGYSIQAAGGDSQPSESITLNFTKIEAKYIPAGPDTKAASPIPVGYDLETVKKL